MRFFESILPSRRLLALFLILLVAPAAGLAWLGWRLLEQDRALTAQRAIERQEYAADLVAGALERRITADRSQLAQFVEESELALKPDAVIVKFLRDDFRHFPPDRLLFNPVVLHDQDAPPVDVYSFGDVQVDFACGEDRRGEKTIETTALLILGPRRSPEHRASLPRGGKAPT